MLVARGHLSDTKNMLACEQLGIFLRGVAHAHSYRQLYEFFQHSLEIVSRLADKYRLPLSLPPMFVAISYPRPSPFVCNIFQSRNSNPELSIRLQISLKCRCRVVGSLPDPTEGAKVEYTPWLIAGLGNPGNKYHGTRHNVGFEMVDCIARAEGIRLNTIQSKALFGIGSFGKVPILLVKPQAYMNFIGESIGPLAAYYQVPLRHILLIYDEMSLPNGVLRLSPKGGHGHHSGFSCVASRLDGMV
ncbi:hypothetical protein M5K25_021656 [Dendrobium thyrsiflorum]|uniref:DUF8040 domain-containing protein n=1 Tax=Dendrobium thyrsiflorum TaxID=117978 RepID=A0ABD0UCY0_DENTH